jgi:amino acid adenylation domain-containing protein
LEERLRESAADVFHEVAARFSSYPAIRHGRTNWTYSQLARMAGGIAGELSATGVSKGAVVATVLERSPWCAAAALGAWAAGAAYVHIESADPDARVRAILASARPAAVLADKKNAERLPGGTPPVLILDAGPADAPYRPSGHLSGHDLAYLVFTSGSTGVPKAVAIEHRSLLNYLAAFRKRIGPLQPNSYAATTTWAADLGNTCIFGALLSGARLDIYDRMTTLDPAEFARELQAHQVDCVKYTPSQLEMLSSGSGLAPFLPESLLILGGEAFPPWLAWSIMKERPDLHVYNHYGPSETTIGALMHRVRPADAQRTRVPVGTAIPGIEIRVVSSDSVPVADGQPGVLHIGGTLVARGYLGDQELTNAKFVVHSGGRFYRTDDIVIVNDEGEVEFLGRADRQVKIRGHRVEPAEVEKALTSLPGVRRALVTAESTPGEGQLELVAYLVTDSDPDELTARLRADLPASLVPSRIHRVSGIPLNSNGKVDFAMLRQEASRIRVTRRGAPAQGATERLVAEIWASVLGIPEVGRQDKFLDLGGDSFKALMIYGRLRRHFPGMTIAHLYEHPAVADLACALDASVDKVPSPPRSVKIVEL